MYYIDPFEEIDSTVPLFADEAVCRKIKRGSQFLVGIGNYFYNVFNLGFRLGIFYDFTHKRKDKITVQCKNAKNFKPERLEKNFDARSHRFGWNLTYKSEALLELNIGSQHILSGKNIMQLHEIFASIIATF